VRWVTAPDAEFAAPEGDGVAERLLGHLGDLPAASRRLHMPPAADFDGVKTNASELSAQRAASACSVD
jgi:hypothetical protein